MADQTVGNSNRSTFILSEVGQAYRKIWSTVSAVGRLPNTQVLNVQGTGYSIAQQMEAFDASFPRAAMLGMIGKLQRRVFELDGIACTGLDFWQKTSLSLFRQQVIIAATEDAELLAFKTYMKPSPTGPRHRTESFTAINTVEYEDETIRMQALSRAPSELPRGAMPELLYENTIVTPEFIEHIADAAERLDISGMDSLADAVASFVDPDAVAATLDHPANGMGVIISENKKGSDFAKEAGLLVTGAFEIMELNNVIKRAFDING